MARAQHCEKSEQEGADDTEIFYTYACIYLHVCTCIHKLCNPIYTFL